MTATTIMTVTPPPCTPWCTDTHDVDGWDEVGRDTVKFCHFTVPVDATMPGWCGITMERYACVTDGRMEIEAAEVRVEIAEAFSPADTIALADALRRAAGLAAEVVR